ncbi:MAG: hypothetical protein HY211_04630 [Candidatus Omnitrophica bacterium]|nr:hypothetical protein [Candidatus Omnitrophota bacterium]
MNPVQLFFTRTLTLFLTLCLALPAPSFALRNETTEGAGLEEKLAHSLQDGNPDAAFKTVTRQIGRLVVQPVPPVPGTVPPSAGLEEEFIGDPPAFKKYHAELIRRMNENTESIPFEAELDRFGKLSRVENRPLARNRGRIAQDEIHLSFIPAPWETIREFRILTVNREELWLANVRTGRFILFRRDGNLVILLKPPYGLQGKELQHSMFQLLQFIGQAGGIRDVKILHELKEKEIPRTGSLEFALEGKGEVARVVLGRRGFIVSHISAAGLEEIPKVDEVLRRLQGEFPKDNTVIQRQLAKALKRYERLTPEEKQFVQAWLWSDEEHFQSYQQKLLLINGGESDWYVRRVMGQTGLIPKMKEVVRVFRSVENIPGTDVRLVIGDNFGGYPSSSFLDDPGRLKRELGEMKDHLQKAFEDYRSFYPEEYPQIQKAVRIIRLQRSPSGPDAAKGWVDIPTIPGWLNMNFPYRQGGYSGIAVVGDVAATLIQEIDHLRWHQEYAPRDVAQGKGLDKDFEFSRDPLHLGKGQINPHDYLMEIRGHAVTADYLIRRAERIIQTPPPGIGADDLRQILQDYQGYISDLLGMIGKSIEMLQSKEGQIVLTPLGQKLLEQFAQRHEDQRNRLGHLAAAGLEELAETSGGEIHLTPLLLEKTKALVEQVRLLQVSHASPALKEKARNFELIYLRLPEIAKALIAAYRDFARKEKRAIGKIRLYLVGGRLKGKPLELRSDIDFFIASEKPNWNIGSYGWPHSISRYKFIEAALAPLRLPIRLRYQDYPIPSPLPPNHIEFFDLWESGELPSDYDVAEKPDRLLLAAAHDSPAGMEEDHVRIAEEVPIGEWDQEVNKYLVELGGIKLKTEHYGEGTIFLRADKLYPAANWLKVNIFAAEEWVRAHEELNEKLSVGHDPGKPKLGRLLGVLAVERKQVDAKGNAAFIIANQLFSWTLRLQHRDEIEARRIAIEAVGEWGKSRQNPVPVYLIGPKAIRKLKPELSDPTVRWNYEYPVNRSIWGTERVHVRDSAILWDTQEAGPLKWFVYRGKPHAAGLEEKESKRLLEDLIEDSKGPLAQAVRQGQRIAVLVDPLVTGASVEELAAIGNLFADRLRDFRGYPVVEIKPLVPGAAEKYRANRYQVIQLKLAPREVPIDSNTVYVQLPSGSDRLIPVKFLLLVVSEAIARWQRAQGAVLTSPMILPAAPYLNAAGLSLDDIWDILSTRFA